MHPISGLRAARCLPASRDLSTVGGPLVSTRSVTQSRTDAPPQAAGAGSASSRSSAAPCEEGRRRPVSRRTCALAGAPKWMRLPLCPVILVFVAGTSVAQDADPLKSTACVRALEALQAQETALTAAARYEGSAEQAERPLLASLETLRRQAARACLGSRQDAPPPVQQLSRPPVALAPATTASAGWLVLPSVPAAAPPPIPIPPLRTITACDPMGCWANDGTRLQRMGSTLFGPLGLCTVQGAVLSCP